MVERFLANSSSNCEYVSMGILNILDRGKATLGLPLTSVISLTMRSFVDLVNS